MATDLESSIAEPIVKLQELLEKADQAEEAGRV